MPIMATLTISLSDEEMRRLKALGKREGLTIEQMVRLGINDFIGQLDNAFHAGCYADDRENLLTVEADARRG